jgi:hypothetical protein
LYRAAGETALFFAPDDPQPWQVEDEWEMNGGPHFSAKIG